MTIVITISSLDMPFQHCTVITYQALIFVNILKNAIIYSCQQHTYVYNSLKNDSNESYAQQL